VLLICSPSTAPAKIAFLPTLMPMLKLTMAFGSLDLMVANEQGVIWLHPVTAWMVPLVGNQPPPAPLASYCCHVLESTTGGRDGGLDSAGT
jgi:hypothetical protein